MDGRIAILLVEDNVDDVAVLRRFIRRLPGSFLVDIAYMGGEAKEKAAAQTYDLALVDQNLPDIAGHDLIGELRSIQPHMPVVMLTGHGDERLAVEVMKAGAYDYLRKDDLDANTLERTFRNVLERARLEAEVHRANERLLEWAIRDGLTGLYNHRHFQELLHTEFARARRYDQPLACLMVDLDHFKRVNDTFGHPFGDEVLKQLAATLTDIARQADIIARYGGEEFVVVLPSTDLEGAARFAERLCTAVAARTVVFDGSRVDVTLSVGVATNHTRGVDDEKALIKRADAALYEAKRTGRNRVCLADDRDPLGEVPTPLAFDIAAVHEAPAQLIDTLVAVNEAAEGTSANQRHHGRRVAELAVACGARLGLPSEVLDVLRVGGLLHDLGRIGVAQQHMGGGVADPLAAYQQAPVQRHATLGADLAARCSLRPAEVEVIRHHHERWDGAGYPDGLAGEAIPLTARIVAVADAFDSLTAGHRDGASRGAALETLGAMAGSAYDPRVIEAMHAVVSHRREDAGR